MLNNIHYKFNVFKKQNLTSIVVELEEEEEEEEEADCSRDHTAKKKLHKYRHPSLISSP
jgi:hypothetical protein